MLKGIEIWGNYKNFPLIKDLIKKAGINTTEKLAIFLSQCHHESAGFTRLLENLNYTPNALIKTFGSRFNLMTAKKYGRNEEHPANQRMIANIAYANRKDLGNGDIESGDGWNYRGRGYLQITGKEKYKEYGKRLNEDFLKEPDKVQQPLYAFATALLYWIDNKLSNYDNIEEVTKIVNGPAKLGLSERQDLFIQYIGEITDEILN